MKNYDWIICGGGVKGIFCAYQLNRLGFNIAIIDSAPVLGGVLSAIRFEDYYLDLGCHLFDNSSADVTEMMIDLNQNEIKEVHVSYSSKLMNQLSENFAVPDFSIENNLNNKIYREMTSITDSNRDSNNYSEYLKNRFGPTASNILEKASKKILRKSAKELDVGTKNVLPFSRIAIADDAKTFELKKNNSLLNDRIANSHKFKNFPKEIFNHMNFYPKNNGTHGFVKNSENYLKRNGVDIFKSAKINQIEITNSIYLKTENGEELNSNYCYWSSDLTLLENLPDVQVFVNKFIHRVPMVLFYFFLKKEQILKHTYIHNFDEKDYIYRTSCPGLYGNQFNKNNLTYVCFEITTDIGSQMWEMPEKFKSIVWNEAISMGQVKGELPEKSHIIKTPVSFKPVKKGFSKNYKNFLSQLSRINRNLFISDPSLYSKIQIASEIQNIIKNL